MKKTRQVVVYYKTEYGETTILAVKGRACVIRLPDEINGSPVTALGDYAFAVENEFPLAAEESTAEFTFIPMEEGLSAPMPSEEGDALTALRLPEGVTSLGSYCFMGCSALVSLRLPEKITTLPTYVFSGCTALERVTPPSYLEKIEPYAFYDCRALLRLHLPQSVIAIGQYAFYNCRRLQEINIPASAVQLGTGLFLNCDCLRDISFGSCRHISDLIATLTHELILTINFGEEKARLFIPDFQYEYIENTPARLFHQVNYGTGHLFRQCIGNSEIDFRRYDELFYLTKREDAAAFVLLLALNRLSYPYRLQEVRKETYLAYIKEHILFAANYLMEHNEEETLRLFARWNLFCPENISPIIHLAQNRKKTGILSFLLDYENAHFKRQKKTFDL